MSEGLSGSLGKKIGPLPAGAWVIVVAGGLGLAYMSTRNRSASPAASLVPLPTLTQSAVTPGAGPSGVGTTEPTVAINAAPVRPPASNDEWLNATVRILSGRGYMAYASAQALGRYLGGEQLTAEDANIVEEALRASGPPPMPPFVAPNPLPPAQPPAPPAGGYNTDLPGYVVSGGRIVDRMSAPGGGEWQLTEDGSIYATGTAPYLGSANGRPYFAGRKAKDLIPNVYDIKPGYTIVATSGEKYSYP